MRAAPAVIRLLHVRLEKTRSASLHKYVRLRFRSRHGGSSTKSWSQTHTHTHAGQHRLAGKTVPGVCVPGGDTDAPRYASVRVQTREPKRPRRTAAALFGKEWRGLVCSWHVGSGRLSVWVRCKSHTLSSFQTGGLIHCLA